MAPNGPEMAAALSALSQRTPLGSCDLENALDTAGKCFASGSKLPRAIVYIGDGSSHANMLTADQLDRVVNDLVARHAPVIAFGIGPRVHAELLGILAARTGGVVVPEKTIVDADAAGSSLAGAVAGSVFWPSAGAAVKWPDGLDVYPKRFPPLRSDRNTVLVGAGIAKPTVAKQVELDVDGPSGAQKLSWDIPEFKSDASNSYLTTLVDRAKADDGRTLPLVDSSSLATAKEEIEAGGSGLADLASDALSGGNLASAEKLASAALRRNPKDPDALAIKDAVKNAATKNAGGVCCSGCRGGRRDCQGG